ncbi:GNAT family N-acetyltransferase [Ornithinimicrobium sufpigmenti]|uniref:GNAT family N-acetyltransferase n=1 Tax=Ornithinimicrobium sufpigmenti TaxID=2508882 RepID=UPI001EE034EC|nr:MULTISPECIES: GNAT family N-acetyltransferase [unclassified Ornithinimicrobium]
MSIEESLPPGLSARPLTIADARAVYQVMADLERAEIGSADIEEADIVADWQRPSVDVPAVTLGVFAGDRMVGYAEAARDGRCDAAVHPDWHGRGIGTALARWMQHRSRELGARTVGMPVPQGGTGDRLLEALGYHVAWTSWVLRLPEGAQIEPRSLPEGQDVRAARAEEYRAVHQVVDEAFLEWADREPQTFEDFEAGVLHRPGFEPWQVRVVVGPDGVVGAAVLVMARDEDGAPVEGYVDKLAVRRDQRGQGLAQALLVDAFALAREHGAPAVGLATDSRTGALSLYEKVGMVVTQTWVHRAIGLA